MTEWCAGHMSSPRSRTKELCFGKSLVRNIGQVCRTFKRPQALPLLSHSGEVLCKVSSASAGLANESSKQADRITRLPVPARAHLPITPVTFLSSLRGFNTAFLPSGLAVARIRLGCSLRSFLYCDS